MSAARSEAIDELLGLRKGQTARRNCEIVDMIGTLLEKAHEWEMDCLILSSGVAKAYSIDERFAARAVADESADQVWRDHERRDQDDKGYGS